MTEAEQLKERAENARSKSDVQIKYEALVEEMKKAADIGMVAISQTKYTVDGLKYTRGGMYGGMSVDYDKMYREQDELFAMLRKNGFEVRMSDLELPSVLDINLSKEEREQIELRKKLIEKQVLVIWDTDYFDAEASGENS